MKNTIYERGQHGDSLTQCMGESGYGMYAIVPPNIGMRRYFMSKGENLIRFKVQGCVVDLTKESLRIIRHIRQNLAETAKNTPGYLKPKVNAHNYHRFPHAVREYMNLNHPEAAGYIVPHKVIGTNLPAGKQLIVTNMDTVNIIEIIKQKKKESDHG